jgi:lipopolysaccharide transport system ATP-binding protein
LTLNSERDAATFNLEPGSNEFECHLPVCGLRPGIYTAKISLIQGSIYVLDAVESFRFEVRSGQDLADSLYFQPRVWSVNGREPARYGEAQV